MILIGSGLPFIKDVPDNIELIYVETPRPDGAFGQAGVGEGPLTSSSRLHHQRNP